MTEAEAVPEISIRELYDGVDATTGCFTARLVDVRAPAEFGVDHLPGAISVPLFDDQERAVVGTLYRHAGPEPARKWGESRVLARVDAFVESLENALRLAATTRDPAVVVCARGGLRSQAVTGLLRGRGHEVVRLRGGYRAYRAHIRSAVESLRIPGPVVLHGLTGVGKTRVLRAIAEDHPDRVLDLEAYAGHRSSVLGAVGLEPASQKLFESRVCGAAERLLGPWTITEWEARRLGDRSIPDSLYSALETGLHLRLTASLETRVALLVDEYVGDATPERVRELATCVTALESFPNIGPEGVAAMHADLDDGRFAAVVARLLESHYDPRYRHGGVERAVAAEFEVREASASEFARVGAAIVRWIEART